MNQKHNTLLTQISTQDRNTEPYKLSSIIFSLCLISVMASFFWPAEVYAASFDLERSATAGLDVLLRVVLDNWGKAVIATGALGAIASPADPAARAMGFFKGCAGAGLAMFALKSGYGIA